MAVFPSKGMKTFDDPRVRTPECGDVDRLGTLEVGDCGFGIAVHATELGPCQENVGHQLIVVAVVSFGGHDRLVESALGLGGIG